MQFQTLKDLEKLPPYEPTPDFHAVDTITLGELLYENVIDLNDESMDFDYYSEEQKARLIQKIEKRYYWREISIIPIKRWKWEYVRLLNEIMPKYKLLYAELENGIHILQDTGEYGKRRNIQSEFPQTMLSGENQDYASSGTDSQYEIIREGSAIDKIADFMDKYQDIDVMILNDMEILFSPLCTVGGINTY